MNIQAAFAGLLRALSLVITYAQTLFQRLLRYIRGGIMSIQAAFVSLLLALLLMVTYIVAKFRSTYKQEGYHGYYLSPIGVNLIVRPILSILGGFTVAFLFFAADRVLETKIISVNWMIALGVLFTIGLARRDTEQSSIVESERATGKKEFAGTKELIAPVNHVGVVTFLGTRYPIYLIEGRYSWIGRRFLLGVSDTPLPNADNVPGFPVSEQQGFVFTGSRIIQIYNDPTKKKEISISNVTSKGSTVFANVVIAVHVVDPYTWARTDDPILIIAERARAGFRRAVSYFNDIDATMVKNVLSTVMTGKPVITAFTRDQVDRHIRGSVVRNIGGVPLYEVVDIPKDRIDGIDPTERRRLIDEARQRFVAMLSSEADPDFLNAITHNGEIKTTVVDIDDKLIPTVQRIGAKLDDIAVSDMALSDAVTAANEAAASEAAQYEAQITSATTYEGVREILKRNHPGVSDELATLLAASMDKNSGVNIIHVTGSGDRLTRALVAGAAQNSRGGNNE